MGGRDPGGPGPAGRADAPSPPPPGTKRGGPTVRGTLKVAGGGIGKNPGAQAGYKARGSVVHWVWFGKFQKRSIVNKKGNAL